MFFKTESIVMEETHQLPEPHCYSIQQYGKFGMASMQVFQLLGILAILYLRIATISAPSKILCRTPSPLS